MPARGSKFGDRRSKTGASAGDKNSKWLARCLHNFAEPRFAFARIGMRIPGSSLIRTDYASDEKQ